LRLVIGLIKLCIIHNRLLGMHETVSGSLLKFYWSFTKGLQTADTIEEDR